MPRKKQVEIDDLVKPHINPNYHLKKQSSKKKVEIDDLVKLHINPNYHLEKQSPKSEIRKVKSKPQKKTKAVIKRKSQEVKKDQLENIVSMETSPSCSYQPKSSNEQITKALINDISYPHSEDLPLNISDSFQEDLDNMNEKDIWEQLTMLHTLNKKETELKTAILFEKLKQEEEFIIDESVLKEKISKLENEVQARRMDLRLQETMCSEVQLMETIRKISLPRRLNKGDDVEEVYDFSEGERGLILGQLLKKEQLKKELSSEQREIAKIEENCWKMNLAIEKCENNSASEKLDMSTTKTDDWKEVECLKTENQKKAARVQLFSRLIQHLIETIQSKHSVNDEFKILSSTCEQIQNWNYDDVDEMGELCKKVHATKI